MSWEIRQGDALDQLRDERGRIVKGAHWRPSRPYWDPEWCRVQYVVRGRSAGEIAAEFGVTDAAILFWLRKHGIRRRTIAEARALRRWGSTGKANPMYGRTGPANPNYVDGSSPERQRVYASAAWRALVRRVRVRDGFRCQVCGAEKSGRKSLHLHHLKPWAGHPELRLDPANVITLCKACHDDAHRKGGDAV